MLFQHVTVYNNSRKRLLLLAMMDHIIRISCCPVDVVADFFMGSGTTCKAAIRLGRRFIGVELERPRYLQTCAEVEELIDAGK
ncbi:site-specific DNA-methyltransferase [Aeromonas veronii]